MAFWLDKEEVVGAVFSDWSLAPIATYLPCYSIPMHFLFFHSRYINIIKNKNIYIWFFKKYELAILCAYTKLLVWITGTFYKRMITI